jgi:hypothetical protein
MRAFIPAPMQRIWDWCSREWARGTQPATTGRCVRMASYSSEWQLSGRPRGLPRITSRNHLPGRQPEDGRAHQIRAHEQEELHAIPSVHQSGSGRHLTKGIRFSPEALCDGFVLHGVLTRGLQFNPQALDAGQPFAVFFDSGPVSQAGSMRQTE